MQCANTETLWIVYNIGKNSKKTVIDCTLCSNILYKLYPYILYKLVFIEHWQESRGAGSILILGSRILKHIACHLNILLYSNN